MGQIYINKKIGTKKYYINAKLHIFLIIIIPQKQIHSIYGIMTTNI